MDTNIRTLQQLRGVKPLRGGKSLRETSGGSVMVETALIFLVFACLLLGAFDFGQFLFVHRALVERARYAARWGAINDPTDATSITNMVLYNAPTGSQINVSVPLGIFN